MKKRNILIAYYSRTGENYFPGGIRSVSKGNTQFAAEYIHNAVGGDLFRIETAKPYSTDYRTCCEEAKQELQQGIRPELAEYPDSLDPYDTVFVCYPNWWGTVPMCILSFLEHYDLTGKTIIPLCTNEGSGMGSSEQDLRKYCRGAVVMPGRAVPGHKASGSEKEITSWAKSVI